MRVIKTIGLILVFGLSPFNANAQEQSIELILQNGHTSGLDSVVFSSNGKMFATGSSDQTIKLWSADNVQELRTLKGHKGQIKSLAFSNDGKMLASGSLDEVKLWNVETGKELFTLEANGWVYEVVFSFDGNILAGGGEENSYRKENVKLWDVSTGQELKTIVHDMGVLGSAVTFSRSGKLLVTGGEDKTVKFWNLETGQFIKALNQNEAIKVLQFSPDEKTLAAGDYKKIVLWDAETGEKIKVFKGHIDVHSIAFSWDGKTLAILDFVGFKILNIETGEELKTIKADNAPFNPYSSLEERWKKPKYNFLALSPDWKTAIKSLHGKFFLELLNTETNRSYFQTKSGNGEILSIVFSPDMKTIASSYLDNSVKLWSPGAGREIQSLKGHNSTVTALTFSPLGKFLASSDGNTVILWDGKTGRRLKTLILKEQLKITTGRGDLDLPFMEKELTKFNYDLTGNGGIAFSADEKMLAGVNLDNVIKLWNTETGEEKRTIKTNLKDVFRLAFSQDGKTLAGAGRWMAEKIYMWDAMTGKMQMILPLEKSSTMPTVLPIKQDLFGIGQLATKDGNWLLKRAENGQIDLVEIKSHKVRASLATIGENDWLVTTPEGFFDGTSAAWKQLIWRFNNNTFDYGAVELYFNDFFYPNLLQDILTGKSPQPKAGQELEKIDRRQPKVEITSINGQTKSQLTTFTQTNSDKTAVTIVIEVLENNSEKKKTDHNLTSGAQDLRLFRNGTLVKVWHGNLFDKSGGCKSVETKSNEPRRVHCQAEVPITAGENNFTAYAFNSANVKSNDAAASIEGNFAKSDGTLYVLAIGINKYANESYNLRFAVPDVEDITKAIKAQQDRLYKDANLKQYARTEVITLKDETATKDNVLLALKRFAKDGSAADLRDNNCANLPENLCAELKTEFQKIKPTEPEDALVIYFAGHGTAREQRFYLLPHGFTGTGGDDSLIKQAVSDIELNQHLEKVDAGKMLMVIDACQSGQALGEKTEGRAPMNSKGLAQLAYDKGMLILTAAQSQQAALEAVHIGGKEIRHGLLTYTLLEAMQNPQANADKDGNKQLWEREWFDFAVEQVPLLQTEAMKQRRIDLKNGATEVIGRSDIIYLNGDDPNLAPEKRRVQTPRVFYRREPDTFSLVVAKP